MRDYICYRSTPPGTPPLKIKKTDPRDYSIALEKSSQIFEDAKYELMLGEIENSEWDKLKSGKSSGSGVYRHEVTGFVFKFYWFGFPSDVSQRERNVKASWENELEVLSTIEGYNPPCVKLLDHGTLQNDTVGFLKLEPLQPVSVNDVSLNKRALELVDELHQLGYSHNDITSTDNFMIRKSTDKLVFIDMETATPVDTESMKLDKINIGEVFGNP